MITLLLLLAQAIPFPGPGGVSSAPLGPKVLISNIATAPTGTASSPIDTTGASLLVCHISYTSTAACADSKSNSWTCLTAKTNAGSNTSRLCYVLSATVGAGHTFTATGAGTFASMEVEAWSNVTSFDQQNGAIGTGATIQPGSITTSTNGELYITGLSFDSGLFSFPPTIDSGFSISDSLDFTGGMYYGSSMGYFVQSSAGALNPTWTLSANDNSATIATFK